MKIGIMGYYPPPIGGIAMHVKRLAAMLDKKQVAYHIYAVGQKASKTPNIEIYTNRRKFALQYLFGPKEDIIHCHTMGWTEKLYYLVAGKLFGKKVIYTFHSFREKYDTLTKIQRIAYKIVLKYGDAFVAVGKSDFEYMKQLAIAPHKLHYIPGFIAPSDLEMAVSEPVAQFMKQHALNICGNSSNMKMHQGQDLYGIDMCIDLMIGLKAQGRHNIGFVFFLPWISDEAYYQVLCQKIAAHQIQSQFMFVHESQEFYPVIKASDLFVRPTNTDGDAISVREALYFGTPAVASDVIQRPEGTHCFKNRDAEDFLQQVLEVLEHPLQKEIRPTLDYGNEIVDLYQRLLSKEKRRSG